MSKKLLPSSYKSPRTISITLVVLLVSVIGTYLILSSHAATPVASINADNVNTITSPATVKPCTGASSSDGNCVIFGSVAATGGTSNKGVPWIGLNDFTGWGPALTSYYLADGFKWSRLDEESGSYTAGNNVDAALSAGLNVVIIVPTNATEAMTWMNAYKGDGSRVVYEFGNEPWTNSNGPAAIPAGTYAQEYQAAYNAKHAAGIPQPLLFMTIGELVDNGPMWLATAMQTVPNLQVDAFSAHPYGEANQDIDNKHSYGVNALLAMHQDAVSRGFANTPWYVTEFGFTLNPAQDSGSPSTSNGLYVPSYAQQAAQLTAAYNQMIAYGDGTSGTWLQGIMWYQTHDDSTGWYGLVTAPTASSKDTAGEPTGNDAAGSSANTPIIPRPAYTALKTFLTNH